MVSGRQVAALVGILLAGTAPCAQAQSPAQKFLGMWSDPPNTIAADFCRAWCTDTGIDRLNALLDDTSNDARPLEQLRTDASNYQRDNYIRPLLTDAALKTYPLDPADDPSFLRCEPYGFAKQIVAPHQLEMRQLDKNRLELHYGEWNARRTVYMDGRKRPPNSPSTSLGYSVGHWEGETLVIETSGIRANITPWQSQHSEQLTVLERYTRSPDGKTLTLSATLRDPWAFKQPIVVKHVWGWRPDQTIAAYDQCEIPKEFKRGTRP
jgi:hypothetical protein